MQSGSRMSAHPPAVHRWKIMMAKNIRKFATEHNEADIAQNEILHRFNAAGAPITKQTNCTNVCRQPRMWVERPRWWIKIGFHPSWQRLSGAVRRASLNPEIAHLFRNSGWGVPPLLGVAWRNELASLKIIADRVARSTCDVQS